jgi:hypothetical protein
MVARLDCRFTHDLFRLLRVIERMDRLNLPVHNMNPVKDVIDPMHRLHVEDSGNVLSLDNVLLELNPLDQRQNMPKKSEHSRPARQLRHTRAFKGHVFGKGHLGQVLRPKAIQISVNHSDFLFS